MKLLLKLLLALGILLAATYAAIPLWLPYVFASQLPPGWQLEKLEVGYPGFSAATIAVMQVSGELQMGSLEFTATNLHYRYEGLKVDIDSVSLKLFLLADNEKKQAALTLDDLSLPITKLTGKLPELSVSQLRVVLHPDTDRQLVSTTAAQPLVLNFQAFNLHPGTDNQIHLSTRASSEAFPELVGQLNLEADTDLRTAEIYFQTAGSPQPWLAVSLEQTDLTDKTTTKLHASFDAGQAGQEWLDILSARVSGGLLTKVGGKLDLWAEFSGEDNQPIEHLSLAAEQLQLGFINETLLLNAELLATRENDKITVQLPVAADIQFQDKAGNIDKLLINAIPELKRNAQAFTKIHTVLDAGSSFVIQAGSETSISFNGSTSLELASTDSSIRINSTELQITIDGVPGLDSISAAGQLTVDWIEQTPIAYAADDLQLKADQFSLSSSGHFRFHELAADFTQSAKLELLSPMIIIAAGPQAPATTITANQLSIDAELVSADDAILSSGNGTFSSVQVSPQTTSADSLALSWQNFDLLHSAGNLTTRTQGFATVIDTETWTGFDFDIAYSLLGNTDIDGVGTLRFDTGVAMPIEFSGNARAEQWSITLPATTIELAELGGLLGVAQIELPESLMLTDGIIGFHGEIVVADEIIANMTVRGYEMDASILESSARQAGFEFNARYASDITAHGPVSIQTLALAGGVDVTDIELELNIENIDTFSLINLQAEIFDGQLRLDQLRFSDNNIENTIVALTNISLGRLLAFADIDGLNGTGNLQMSLPLGSDQSGFHVKDGSFHSIGPGHLAYTKDGIAGGNIGLQALENFQYQDLSGTIDYQSAGGYQINLHLEGKNPELYGGHPIVFNLNIDGSLPALFETMFITGSFEEAILNQVKSNQLE